MKPLQKFVSWYRKAIQAGERLPEAMALATASPSGKPSVRFVLFKGVANDSFIFFTNYKSRKAAELLKNPFAEVAVFWPKIYRQARIFGRVQKISSAESDRYWKTRPRESQIGAWASPQSSRIQSYEELLKRYKLLEKKFAGKAVPRPSHWGGFSITPQSVEFWTGEIYRLHKRERWIRKKRRWKRELLAP